jgi:3-oxoacyl-[acyl-carrier-protein] synthase-3
VNFLFSGKRIGGIHVVLPRRELLFADDMSAFGFSPERSRRLQEVMGYDRHRVVEPGVCVSDLASAGLQHLFDQHLLQPDEFDALLVLTQSPDHFIPPTSNIIQGRLGLKQDLLCLDINQGCAAWLVGLIQACLLLEQPAVRKVLLIAGDVISRRVSPRDRNSFPLIGDGIGIALIEKSPEAGLIHANLRMDGSRGSALTIPAGGFRMPSTPQTALETDAGDSNFRSLDHLHMDGTAVFNFVQREVPPLIDELLRFAGIPEHTIDYYLFHQPNRFMLEKLAARMKVDRARMPSNVVENFGNSSGASIPVNIALNLAHVLHSTTLNVCFAGFGSGLTWSSMLLGLGPLRFCSIQHI